MANHLHKYGRVAKALSIHLATHIVEVNSLPNVPSCVLDCRVAVHVGQLPQAEPVVVLVAWVREPVNDHRVVVGVVHLKIECQVPSLQNVKENNDLPLQLCY